MIRIPAYPHGEHCCNTPLLWEPCGQLNGYVSFDEPKPRELNHNAQSLLCNVAHLVDISIRICGIKSQVDQTLDDGCVVEWTLDPAICFVGS